MAKNPKLKTEAFVKWFRAATPYIHRWGGATLSLYLASGYSPLMSGGRGFMALAALIFGRWQPLPVLAASLFFGLTESLQIRLQGADFGDIRIPVQWIQMIPYIVTLIVVSQPFRKRKSL